MARLFVGNSYIVELAGSGRLVDRFGDPVELAKVDVTMYDGVRKVAGMEWPARMQEDGEGEYSLILPASLDLRAGGQYTMIIEVKAAGSKSTWKTTIQAEERKIG